MKNLVIEEPEIPVVHASENMRIIFGNLPPYLREKKVISYPVIFHVPRVEDFSPRSQSSSGGPTPPSSLRVTVVTMAIRTEVTVKPGEPQQARKCTAFAVNGDTGRYRSKAAITGDKG